MTRSALIALLVAPMVFGGTRSLANAAAAPKYTVRDLGSLFTPLYSTVPTAVNDRGIVVGQSCSRRGTCAAFAWNGMLHRIPVPFDGDATDVNDRGTVVGNGFVYADERLISLGTSSGELDLGRINNTGVVIATSFGSALSAAYVARPPGYAAEIVPGIKYGEGIAINDLGDLLLYGSVDRSPLGYFVRRQSNFFPVGSQLREFTGTAIDNSDDVAGFNLLNSSTLLCHAIVYRLSSRTTIDIGPLSADYPSTRAWAINDHGAVVGGAGFKGSFNEAEHAFYWDPRVGILDLNQAVGPTRYDITIATAINNRGQIVAVGLLPGESEGINAHALLLTPLL